MKKLFFLFCGLLLSLQSYALDVVKVEVTETVDPETSQVISTSENLVFDPAVLLDPISGAVIATICAVAGIFLVVLGCRWVFRLSRGRV